MVNAFFRSDYEHSLEYANKSYALDTTNFFALEFIGESYSFMGKWEDALFYFDRYLERIKELGLLRINEMHRVAFAYWMNGRKADADTYFNLQMEYCLQDIELGRPQASTRYSYYDLASIYAFRGDREPAMENLRLFNRRPTMPFYVAGFMNKDPLFESIRDEPEFQQIVRDVEVKSRAEHERVRQWLEENEMSD